MKKSWKQSPEDCISRVRCMAKDDSGTWDLSENDIEALRHLLTERTAQDAELTRLRGENERLRGRIKPAYIEGYGQAMASPVDGQWPDGTYCDAEAAFEKSDARAALDGTTTKGAE